MQAMRWDGRQLWLLDQLRLPEEKIWLPCQTAEDVAEAIEKMQVRGAPAIGAAAAYGVALAALQNGDLDWESFLREMERVIERLAKTRPTAVNLFWALRRMRSCLQEGNDVAELAARLVAEAENIAAEDVQTNRAIGRHGLAYIPPKARILTHCNTGSLATVAFGTALGIVRTAKEAGYQVHVYADETRPYLQGARLTAFELSEEGIPVTVITDSMAGYLMQKGMVDLVLVGADRIAANGDTANKIGTYSLAVLAHFHNIPFYVAAPVSTIDFSIATGEEITIEERDGEEVAQFAGRRIIPPGVPTLHPAFDVTPHALIRAIITECGVVEKPDAIKMKTLLDGPSAERPAKGRDGHGQGNC